ncbi:Putative ATP-dependent RNA helicase TDRD9, partial [Acanthisitta chloris]
QVILMSASINCKEFADYFTLPTPMGLNPACVFKVEGKPFPIEEYYLDDLKGIVGFTLPSQSFEQPVIEEKLYEVAVSLIQLFDDFEMKSSREKTSLSDTPEHGSVLVFLPGLNDIKCMYTHLSDKFKRWQVYPLHSCVTLEEQNRVFSATLPGYRKVILATNIAESSVTVPDVKYGKLSKNCVHCICARLSLHNMSVVSKALLVGKQCVTLLMRERVTTMLSSLQCCPLGATVLQIKKLDMGEPKALLATALSPPNLGDIERTIVQLKEVGFLFDVVQTE